jgi:alkanesulfonate monooxygenase SsuD/methylene tetrahydromethanopterin reductase-like flavin-dependent oxidoreductase (luciferase family)
MFLSGVGMTKQVFDAYRLRRQQQQRPMREERLAYAGLVYVGDNDEAGYAGARKLMWILTHNIAPLQFRNPPGYASVKASAQLMRGANYAFDRNWSLEHLMENGLAFAGNPDTVYRQIKRHYDQVGGYGNLLMLGQAGFLEHDETVRGITLFAREVYPRLKELRPSAETRAAA